MDKTAVVMSERQGIEIDYCPTCRGIWLDRGELDKIVERTAAEMAPSPPARSGEARPEPFPARHRYSDRYDDDDYRRGDYRKRRKSFLSELFD
jgi:Zn-finger nucleic acid-binding protein